MRQYVYVLQSIKDNQFYVGYTENLKRRLQEHSRGKIHSTMNRRPLTLIYYEYCLDRKDANKREKYLKSAWGKRYIKNRLSYWLTINKL